MTQTSISGKSKALRVGITGGIGSGKTAVAACFAAEGAAVVVVVSAMGNTTNELLALARQVAGDPNRRELDMLEKEVVMLRTSADDKNRLELATARNQADNMCYSLEKTMKEHADKLRDGDKAPLEKAIAKTKEVAKGDDVEAIRAAVNELEQASHAFSKSLYERNAAAGGAAAGGAEAGGAASESAKPADDAIDAEFEVKKD